jgi:hypothetical protein
MEGNDNHLGSEIPGQYSGQSGDPSDCPLDLLCDWSFQLLRRLAHFFDASYQPTGDANSGKPSAEGERRTISKFNCSVSLEQIVIEQYCKDIDLSLTWH